MSTVKIYNQVNQQNDKLSFGISKMEDIYLNRKGEPDAPHRHDFFTILLIDQAKGNHIIDFNQYSLGSNQIFFIAPGQVHQMIEESKSIGFSMVFSNQFLIQNNIPVCFIEDLNLFNDFGESPPLELNSEESQKLNSYAEEIYQIFNSDLSFKYEAIGSLLKLILIYSNNVCSLPKNINPSIHNGDSLLRDFKTLINNNYKKWHTTKEYASQLHITPDHLNRVIKTQTGKTAKEHIQSRIIVAAKRLLYFSTLSNKEIGYELGFSEPANFSAFFKNCVGVSPSKFQSIS
ncbi:AraC family transcriptional regulator [Aquimarina sediminis]|uniref:AraC family transcriptional regulator n=1 Tax=Aquimarina sediminis TaxID=2070536 RepID=UPI000CA0501C|nr:helix-turn-helix domain-containing protein [Aquimarina sediminis]